MPYTDGTFATGAPTVTINSVAYKANSFTVAKSANTVNITDGTGAPAGALSFIQPLSGTAELQFSASTAPEPTTAAENATTGVMVANVSGANALLIITSCTINKPKDAPWTASVNWQKDESTPLTITSDPASVSVGKVTPTPATNVSLVATAAGGYAPYSYEWLGYGNYTNTFAASYNTAELTVTCQVTDNIGNIATVDVDINIYLE